ncbi:DUF1214 domain-containing protein [Pseudaminobacter sp. NGMCC 1.201702]|uniref:DUF1214 domain-containing protein n=1 Tax=Pseudaminobacter sp. NGMCC 1.201702 TaxID=3391825 RepID=UPI0039EF99A7
MLKTTFLVALFLAVAVVGGGASVWYALDAQEGVGAVTIGSWTAFPEIGTPDADPYSRARIAREGVLTLGRAEGLAFIAQRDSRGDILRRNCVYRIEGSVPPARFWTLYAADANLSALKAKNGRPSALHSYEVLHRPRNKLIILAGRHPEPGNWLPLQGSGDMFLVLTLYDTTIASSTGIADVELPAITKSGCDA